TGPAPAVARPVATRTARPSARRTSTDVQRIRTLGRSRHGGPFGTTPPTVSPPRARLRYGSSAGPPTGSGLWRSLVAHPSGGREAAGSNPASPTLDAAPARVRGGGSFDLRGTSPASASAARAPATVPTVRAVPRRRICRAHTVTAPSGGATVPLRSPGPPHYGAVHRVVAGAACGGGFGRVRSGCLPERPWRPAAWTLWRCSRCLNRPRKLGLMAGPRVNAREPHRTGVSAPPTPGGAAGH